MIIDWVIVGVIGSLLGLALVIVKLLHSATMKYLDNRFSMIDHTITELMQDDRCGRKEHAEIRNEINKGLSELYKRLDEHHLWHLNHK